MGKGNKKGLEMKLAFKKKMKEKRKSMKDILKANRAKLIVKNLPFKVDKEQLKTYFEQYGEVEDIDILKRADGKMKGCAFVQYKLVQKAAKAKHYTDNKLFLDRIIKVDFAKPKSKFEKEKKIKKTEVKSENNENDIDLSIVKIEDKDNAEVEVKLEDEEQNIIEEIEKEDSEDLESSSESDSENDDSISEEKLDVKDAMKKPHVISNDVSEGKTVFIKNIPFSATNDELKECMSQFGPVYYALICIDPLTEHSKGTGFIKFRHKEDAEKCLQAGTELTLQGNILDCYPAMHKNDIVQKSKEKNVKQKDSRNLYLVKEGVILAGTKASEGVSASDMAKRLQLEQYKTQMLRNLNMYVSKTRLIIHNLPPTWNDTKLKALIKKHTNPKAIIREARIMRDMRNIDSQGIGKSKEYGFVSFTTHEDALKALRSLNNNPKIFSENKRPIVAFSIENRVALKAKEKQLQRSKVKNPNYKHYNPNLDIETNNNMNRKNKQTQERSNQESISNNFTGVTAKPGVNKMRNKFKLKTQAKLHFENLKKEKKKKKNSIKTLKEKRLHFRKQPKQKINIKEQDKFSVLVDKYKQNLKTIPLKSSKWYE